MARYSVVGEAPTTDDTTIGEVANNGTNRRLLLEQVVLGSDGVPADHAAEFQLRRTTGLNGPSTTSVTPFALDQADQAAVSAAWEDPDVEPTYATGAILEIALQLRSPFRWTPLSRRSMPTVPASTGAGWGIVVNTVTTAWDQHFTFVYEE